MHRNLPFEMIRSPIRYLDVIYIFCGGGSIMAHRETGKVVAINQFLGNVEN